jgi:hypothetical protein
MGLGLSNTAGRSQFALLVERTRTRLRGLRFKERPASDIPPETLARIDLCWSVGTGLGVIEPLQGVRFQARGARLALDAGEPGRIVRSLAWEASISSARGPAGAARAARLMERARALAARVPDPRAGAIVLTLSGIAGHLRGEFRQTHADLQLAEQALRSCTGLAFELDTARQFKLESLFYLGELGALAAQVPEAIRESEERGALLPATNLRTGLTNVIWLMTDDPKGARREAQAAIARWSRKGFFQQHWYDLLAQSQIDLYDGEGAAANGRVVGVWPALQRAGCLSFHHPRTAALHLRARSAVARAAASAGAERARALHAARKDARILRRSGGWARGLGVLVEASVAAVAGNVTAARSQLDQALGLLDAADMGLYATATRLRATHRPDEAAEARARMLGWGVKDPDRFAAMLVPGLAGDLTSP